MPSQTPRHPTHSNQCPLVSQDRGAESEGDGLPGLCTGLSSIPSIQEAEAGGSGVPGQNVLHRELKAAWVVAENLPQTNDPQLGP